jgi:hypothetical protein
MRPARVQTREAAAPGEATAGEPTRASNTQRRLGDSDTDRRLAMAWAGGYRAPKKARGYGYEFQKLRKQLLPSAYGTPCVRCGEPMLKGQELHLDHADDRSRILGFSHRKCNLRAAARKARAIQLYRKSRIKTDAHRW